MALKCCEYKHKDTQKHFVICTTDATCPGREDATIVSSWGVEKCEDCKVPVGIQPVGPSGWEPVLPPGWPGPWPPQPPPGYPGPWPPPVPPVPMPPAPVPPAPQPPVPGPVQPQAPPQQPPRKGPAERIKDDIIEEQRDEIKHRKAASSCYKHGSTAEGDDETKMADKIADQIAGKERALRLLD